MGKAHGQKYQFRTVGGSLEVIGLHNYQVMSGGSRVRFESVTAGMQLFIVPPHGMMEVAGGPIGVIVSSVNMKKQTVIAREPSFIAK